MRQKKNVGLILAVLGILLLIENKNLLKIGWGGFWPFFILSFGLLFFLEYLTGIIEKGTLSFKKELLIPGVLFTGAGLFLFLFSLEYLSWNLLAGLWPVFILLLGVGFFLAFLTDRSDKGLLIPGGAFLFLSIIGLEILYYKERFGPLFIFGALVIIILLFRILYNKFLNYK